MKNFEKFEKQAEKIANLMIQKIESIEGNWEKPWISVKSRNRFIPENINWREYTGSNKLLLSFVCEISVYKAPHFPNIQTSSRTKTKYKKGIIISYILL